MRIGSLCSGYGGLDMAAEKVFGAETVWHAEIDPAASKVLAKRRPKVPNFGDLTEINWSALRFHLDDVPSVSFKIDILCAGWPCQPWSLAGKKQGAADERAIWPEIARAVRELRPRYVFLENVSAVVVLGELARAAGDLAQAGYDAQWCCVSASEVGAPHKRERFFLLATDTESSRRGVWPAVNVGEADREVDPPWRDSDAAGLDLLPTPKASDCSGGKHNSEGHADSLPGTVRLLPTPRTTDANGAGAHGVGGMDLRTAVTENAGQWGRYAPAIRRWEHLTRPAPAPTEPNTKGNSRLSARFAEWMMGLPAGWVTDVDIPRTAQLKILGNGVVPQQATAALRWLLSVAEMAA